MHLHVWDTPPIHILDGAKCKPYLIEYPSDIMAEKVKTITYKLENSFHVKMRSHRVGRWAINEEYERLLIENGCSVDCSVTPGISWEKQKGAIDGGSNYLHTAHNPYYLDSESRLLEVPMTIRRMRVMGQNYGGGCKGVIRFARDYLIGKPIWMRPSICTDTEMYSLLEYVKSEDSNYLEFMMHSSEFVPGGSPYYSTDGDIQALFYQLDMLFEMIASEYSGCTLANFAEQYACKERNDVS